MVNERHEIETFIISSLLQDRERFQPLLAVLSEDDFQERNYGSIFLNIKNDLELNELRSGTTLKPSEFAKLIMMNSVPSTAYGYAEKLKQFSTKEKLEVELRQIQSKHFDMDQAAERITSIFENSKVDLSDDAKTLGELMETAVHEIIETTDARNKIIYSPFNNLNSLIGGLMGGKLITIAGRPGTGKSAYALQVALSVSNEGRKVLYGSLEMLGTELAMRVFSTDTGISTITMANGKTTGEELKEITASACNRKKTNLLVTNKCRTILEVKRQLLKTKPELFVIDSINLMQGKGESERIRMTGITRELKQLALQYKIPIIMLAQLNREAEGQILPTLNLLKESGSIEEDSDVVILLSEIKDQKDFDKINDAFKDYEGDYMIDPVNGFKTVTEARDKIIIGVIAKNRNGASGKVAYLCKAKQYIFKELPEGVVYLGRE